MAAKVVIGIDIGTQGTKSAVFDAQGRCLGQAFEPSCLHQPSPGVVEEDPEYQLHTVCVTVQKAIQAADVNKHDIAAIAIDGQTAGIIGIGQDGRAVTVYDSWLDTRCATYIEKMQAEAGDTVLAKTGNVPSFNHGPKILWWMHQRPQVYDTIACFIQPAGYAALRLCGLTAEDAFIDTTYLHFSGFADNKNKRWDVDLCRRFGVDPAKLPRIVEPDEIVGRICPTMAEKCGLAPGTPVAAGCGDTTASFLAAGAISEGICVDVAGTASVFSATVGAFTPDTEYKTLSCSKAAVPGLWNCYAYINGGGMNLEWFVNQILNGQRNTENMDFAAINALAEQVDPRDVPFFVPHTNGRVSPPMPLLKGAWVNLSWNQSPAHLYRAILESVAFEYGLYRNVLKRLIRDIAFREIRITGGGQNSRLWNTIKASVLGVPVVQLHRKEGAPLGSAMLAGVAVGLFDSIQTIASQWVTAGEVCQPDETLGAYYTQKLNAYEHLLTKLNEWSIKENMNR